MAKLDTMERRRIRRWDLAIIVWVAVCLALAVWTGIEVANLRSLTGTLESSSSALQTTGDALARLQGAPLVGDDIGEVAARINETARSARVQAVRTKTTIGQLAILIALAIVVISVIPPVVAYLAVRRAWLSGAHSIRE